MEQAKDLAPLFSRRRLMAGTALTVLGGGAAFYMSSLAPGYAGLSLNVREAHQQAVAGDITLIDIRRPDEWALTGIGEGAHPIDMRRDDFTEALVTLVPDRAAPIALICARGVRSARMANRMSREGFSNIIDVPEGMLGSAAGPGWLASDLPTLPYKEPT